METQVSVTSTPILPAAAPPTPPMQEILKSSLTGAGLLQHAGCLLGSWAGAGDVGLMALVSVPALWRLVVRGRGGGHIWGPDHWQHVG